jgi:hypothetical protein
MGEVHFSVMDHDDAFSVKPCNGNEKCIFRQGTCIRLSEHALSNSSRHVVLFREGFVEV